MPKSGLEFFPFHKAKRYSGTYKQDSTLSRGKEPFWTITPVALQSMYGKRMDWVQNSCSDISVIAFVELLTGQPPN